MQFTIEDAITEVLYSGDNPDYGNSVAPIKSLRELRDVCLGAVQTLYGLDKEYAVAEAFRLLKRLDGNRIDKILRTQKTLYWQ